MTKTLEHIAEHIAEPVMDAFFFLDEQLVFVYLNEAAAQLFGYPKSALVGKKFLEVAFEMQSFHQQYSKAVLEKRPFQQDSDKLVPGRWHRVRVEIEADGLWVSIQDVTEFKQVCQWRQKQAEKDLLIADQLCKRSNFFNDLVKGPYAQEYTLQQLTYYGVDPSVRYCCFALRLVFSGQEESSGVMQRLVGWLFEEVAGWTWRSGENLLCLVPEKAEQCFHKQEQMEYAEKLVEVLQEQFPGTQFIVGVSGLSEAPLNLKVIYNKAHSALLVAASLAKGEIYHFDELGIYGVAVQLLKGDPLSNGYKTKLEQLAEYDAGHDGTLMMTLERILEDENLKVVANKLFIHYNTVLWRKKQIEKVLDLSLDHFETRCLLLLYMRMGKIQKIPMK